MCPTSTSDGYQLENFLSSRGKSHRIKEQAEVEGTQKDHWVQLLALHETFKIYLLE